jgi:S1-C subfamily serine protease
MELPSLITTGSYIMHPLMGIQVVDMSYQLAQLQETNVTYGMLIESVTPGGPADKAGLVAGSQMAEVEGSSYTIGGDIIIALNCTKIVNTDALFSYHAENTLAGQTLVVQIIRNGQLKTVDMVLGTRPPAPSG